MVDVFGQPQQQKMFCPGLICAANGSLLPVFRLTGVETARSLAGMAHMLWRGTGFKESRSGNAQVRKDAVANVEVSSSLRLILPV